MPTKDVDGVTVTESWKKEFNLSYRDMWELQNEALKRLKKASSQSSASA